VETRPYWFNAQLPPFPTVESDLEVDVVVVGAGLTGITAAFLLKQAGATVALARAPTLRGSRYWPHHSAPDLHHRYSPERGGEVVWT
jgi:monoamine oxidase